MMMSAWVLLAASVSLPPPVDVGGAVAAARKLYAEASYEKALETLDHATAGRDLTAEEEQVVRRYRALCFLALDRAADARQVVEDLVRTDPLETPGPADPPKLRDLIQESRARLVPEIVRERYARGRAHFDNKAFSEAQREFTAVAALVEQAESQGSPDAGLVDLGLLAKQFLDLLSARTMTILDTTTVAAAVPDPPFLRSTDAPADVVAPVPIQQHVPPWPDALRKWLTTRREGVLELRITQDGSVESARMAAAIHVAYDRLLLDAAKAWRYRPALRQGQPVPFTSLVRIIIPPAAAPPE